MRIVEHYQNIFEEYADTMAEKDKETRQQKVASLTLKAFGALTMLLGAKITLGVIAAVPTSGLGLIALTCGVALTILGYDLAEIGHTIRENIDQPFQQIGKGILHALKNAYDMGAEKGLNYTFNAINAQNTILISKVVRIAVHFRS